MKAVIFEKPFELKIKEVPNLPDPQEGEIKISVKNVGICGADIADYKGKVDLSDLFTHKFSFKDVEKGFKTALNSDSNALKIMIEMN